MSAPERLVDAAGNVRVGIFSDPIAEVNHRDFPLTDPFGRRRGRLGRHFAFKQFQFFGAVSERLVFGCAIADLKYVSTAFAYCYDPATRKLAEYSVRRPFAIGTRFNVTPETGSVTFRAGATRIEMEARAMPRERRLEARLAGGLGISAVFDEEQPPIQPMFICTRTGPAGWVFARKTAGVGVRGTLSWDRTTHDLGAIGALGHHDWSAGFMRRETFWNWGCLAGRLADGRVVGLNVSCGVNETSFTENCFWIDGRLHKVDAVAFEYDRTDLSRPWRLDSYDGRVRLRFTPEGRHAERVNAWLVASNFNQLFGRFDGQFTTAGGECLPIHGMLGYVESHYAKW